MADWRTTMAEMFEVIFTQKEDQVKKKLITFRHLLDIDIKIAVGSQCTCVYNLEKLPVYARSGNVPRSLLHKIVKVIRRGGCACSYLSKDQRSASVRLLHVAAVLKRPWLVEFLLDQGCAINVYTLLGGLSPVIIAIMLNRPEVVKMFVARGACLKQRAPGEKIPLIEAVIVWGIDVAIMNGLLESGQCDVDTTSPESGEAALVVAMSSSNFRAVRMLLIKKANPNVRDEFGDSLLYLAVVEGNLDLVVALIKSGAKVDVTNEGEETALHAAVRIGNREIVAELLSQGADGSKCSRGEYKPLYTKLESMKMYEILKVLLIYRPDASLPSLDEFHKDYSDANEKWWEILFHLGACPNGFTPCKRWTPLALAAHGCFIGVLPLTSIVLSNINWADDDGLTPLHFLTYHGNDWGVRLLLEHGADPNVADKFNTTPLWNAVCFENADIARTLILNNALLEISSRGMELDEYDREEEDSFVRSSERSVLWLAVEWGCVDIVNLLVDAGYNVWKEKWIMQNNTEDLSEDSVHIVESLQCVVQQAPSLMMICRGYLRAKFGYSTLEYLVRTSLLPETLKDFLLLKGKEYHFEPAYNSDFE